ncbi:MAG TPA: cyclophilin-like fold protein [Thermodesulfovibrionales bacterium]|nr:cyclophilin-like fold protein [Thermodesulfovibrionales bacterium]
MPTKIEIILAGVCLRGELADTDCAKAIAALLPIEAVPNEWGDEFYFEIPLRMDLDETATRRVKAGDIGFWPPGNALAIFFGPTPMSRGKEPVPASAVNIVGTIQGDPAVLTRAKGSGKIRMERTQQ